MREFFINGVKPLQQFMEDGSFLMPEIPAVLRAVQAMNAPVEFDYDYLLSVSGIAVRLAWQQGWAEYEAQPNQAIFYNQDGKDITEVALDRIGVKYTRKHLSEVGVRTAQREIHASINNGIPVLASGGPLANIALLGYRDDELYGVSTFTDPAQRKQPHNYNRVEDWQHNIRDYILIEQFVPKHMDAALLIETLKTAIYLARTSRADGLGDTALGVSAFDAVAELMVWDEGFEPLDANGSYDGAISFPYDRPHGYYRMDGARSLSKRFWAGYCDFLCMLNGYENFARFLERYACILPAHSGQLKEAAANYRHACVYSGELWNYVTPDEAGVGKFKERSVRYAFAAHMLRAKIYTIRAIELLEKVTTA